MGILTVLICVAILKKAIRYAKQSRFDLHKNKKDNTRFFKLLVKTLVLYVDNTCLFVLQPSALCIKNSICRLGDEYK